MKILLFIVSVCLLSLVLIGSQKTLPSDILPPQTMEVDENRLYLATEATITILSLPDLKIQKKIGKSGEGPGEFIIIDKDIGVTMTILKDSLFVNSRGKVSYFTKNGKLIKEIRSKNGDFFKPMDDMFIGIGSKMKNKTHYNIVTLFDKKFNIKSELQKKKNWYQVGEKIDPINVRNPLFCVYNNFVLTNNKKGNIIIFDKTGKKRYSTNIKFKQRKINEQDKINIDNYYKTHPAYKTVYANIKHLIKFAEHYPFIKYFNVADSKLYVFTYIKKNDKSELYIFNLKGKLLEKKYISIPDIDPQEVYPLIRLKNGKIYQIIKNKDDEDELDLVITKI